MSWNALEAVSRLQASTSPTCRLVLYSLAWFHNWKTGLCCPSQETIAAHCGLTKRSVQRALSDLQARGLLRSVPRSGGGSVGRASDAYEFGFPIVPLGSKPGDAPAGNDDRVSPKPASGNGDSVSEYDDTKGGEYDDTESPEQVKENNTNSAHARASAAGDAEWPGREDGTFDIDLAVSWILNGLPAIAVDRTDQSQLSKGLFGLISQRPSHLSWDKVLQAVRSAMRTYCQRPEKLAEGGRYLPGVHKIIFEKVFRFELYPAALAPLDPKTRTGTSDDMLRKCAEGWAAKGWWPERMGPPPNEPGCRASDAVLALAGIDGPAERRKTFDHRLRMHLLGRWAHGWGPEPGEPGCNVAPDLLEAYLADPLPWDDDGRLAPEADDMEGEAI